MFPTVAETLGEVCSCGRELCSRQLGLKPCKPYLFRVLWSVWILCEQISCVCVCVCVCVYPRARARTHTHTHIYIYIYIYTHIVGRVAQSV